MTNETELLETAGAQIVELTIDPAYKDKALEQIKTLVKGNKCDPETVAIKEFDGKILRFRAENILTLATKKTTKRIAGRVNAMEQVANENAANEAMDKAYLSLMGDRDIERKILSAVLDRKDKGFGIDNLHIQLPFLKKDYVTLEPCKSCRATGKVMCLSCNGKGRILCKYCKGTRMVHCPHCHGASMINDAQGKKIPCPMCQGHGKIGCTKCNQTGYILCKICAGRGETTCPNCQGSAWSSLVYTQDFHVHTAFNYPRNNLPEKVAAMIESLGAKMSEYAKINISEDPVSINKWLEKDQIRQQQVAEIRKDLRIPILFDVTLPYGHIEYIINNKSYYLFLFGQQAEISHVSPFIDDLISNGIRKLQDAAEERGDVHENLKTAAEYRTIKEGIVFASTSSLGKAKKRLRAANVVGISDSAIDNIINYSDRAIKNITKKPRIIGQAIAALFYAAIMGVYFLSPLRSLIMNDVSGAQLHLVIDLIIMGGLSYIGGIAIQITAQSAVAKTMRMFLPKDTVSALPPPKLGKTAYFNIAVAALIFITMVECTRHVSGIAIPQWYIDMINMF